MKQGAQDFVTKPLDYAKLRSILQATENDIELRRKSQRLLSQLDQGACRRFRRLQQGHARGVQPPRRA